MTEALLALAILGLGLLSVLQWWQPQLQQQRQQLAHEAAMRLASDLSERMALNATQAAAYAQTWQDTPSSLNIARDITLHTPQSTDCRARACAPSELATWDVQHWRQQVQSELPAGDAAVFAAGDGWWGIVLAWQDAREAWRTDTTRGTPPCPTRKSCWRLWIQL